MVNISSVIIYLDDNQPEYLSGTIRIGAVELLDKDNQIIDDNTITNSLIDNASYSDNDRDKLIADVASRLGVEARIITIENN